MFENKNSNQQLCLPWSEIDIIRDPLILARAGKHLRGLSLIEGQSYGPKKISSWMDDRLYFHPIAIYKQNRLYISANSAHGEIKMIAESGFVPLCIWGIIAHIQRMETLGRDHLPIDPNGVPRKIILTRGLFQKDGKEDGVFIYIEVADNGVMSIKTMNQYGNFPLFAKGMETEILALCAPVHTNHNLVEKSERAPSREQME